MGKLTIKPTPIAGVYEIDTSPFIDERGEYTRWYCENEMKDLLGSKRIVNINYQKTNRAGTVRGLHYQVGCSAETKIIRCLHGQMMDVVVDVRRGSPTFLKYYSVVLTESNRKMLFVPEGLAHGFQTLSDDCETMYCTTEFYNPDSERGLNPMDPMIDVKWMLPITAVSEKDNHRMFIDDGFNGV